MAPLTDQKGGRKGVPETGLCEGTASRLLLHRGGGERPGIWGKVNSCAAGAGWYNVAGFPRQRGGHEHANDPGTQASDRLSRKRWAADGGEHAAISLDRDHRGRPGSAVQG